MSLVDELIAELKGVCAGLPDKRRGPRDDDDYAMADIGLSAFSIFFMGSPSFLAHQRALAEGHGRSNCETLFGMSAIPSDNYIRLMLDGAPIVGKLASKASFIGGRPIVSGVRSPSTFTLDADATLRWRIFEVGLRAENLTNLQYALTPFYGPANFPIGNIPANRTTSTYTFTAAPPRAFYGTLAVIFGGP